MSADDSSDDADDFDLPAVESDTVATGAAADSLGCDERLKGLPRLLRSPCSSATMPDHIEAAAGGRDRRALSESCLSTRPGPRRSNVDAGLALAAELDHRAVARTRPEFAQPRRLVSGCCACPRRATRPIFEDSPAGWQKLCCSLPEIAATSDEQLCCDVERFVFGWAALPACSRHDLPKHESAAANAVHPRHAHGGASHRCRARPQRARRPGRGRRNGGGK